jgi:pimeloyl-ACP methyl ester carboxylesterase
VARVVYVDSMPPGDGGLINDELPAENGEIPLPDWSLFEAEDMTDLGADLREAFRARAIPTPEHVATDRLRLSDDRRYDVPVTVIACEFSSEMLSQWLEQGHPAVRELARIREVGYVDLPTGHWPQFTRPADLGEAILASVAPSP